MKALFYSINPNGFEHNFEKIKPRLEASNAQVVTLLESKSTKLYWKDRDIGHHINRALSSGDSITSMTPAELAISTNELFEICFEAIKNGISIHFLIPATTLSPTSNCGTQELLYFASKALDILPTRKKHKSKGGRPKGSIAQEVMLDAHKEHIEDLLSKGVSKASIAKIVGCSRPTLYAYLKRNT